MAAPNFQPQRSRPRTASPIVRELFEIARRDRVRIIDIANAMDMTSAGIHLWKSGGCTPDMMKVEAFAEFLGRRIVLEKVGGDVEGKD